MNGPFVGLPLTEPTLKCAHSADLDQPRCEADAVLHLAVKSEGWGVVGLLTCATHRPVAAASGEVVDYHPATSKCEPITGECWS